MWGWAAAGISVLGGLFGYQSDRQAYANQKAQAEYQRKLQAYRNKMVNISAAQSQNAITTNETSAIQQSARKAQQIQQQGMQLESAVELQSSATGTTGRSVELAKMHASRTVANAEYDRQEELKDVKLQNQYQRTNVEMSRIMQQDNSWIQNPEPVDATGHLISMGVNLFGAMYNSGMLESGTTTTTSTTPTPTRSTVDIKTSSSIGFMGNLLN